MSEEAWIQVVVPVGALTVMIAYVLFRFGPKRCPGCARWAASVWGLSHRFHRCRHCGREFRGQVRPH